MKPGRTDLGGVGGPLLSGHLGGKKCSFVTNQDHTPGF